MMTRKDYVATAEILNKFSQRIDPSEFQDLIFEFSEMFLEDNPRFDEDRFWKACIAEDVA